MMHVLELADGRNGGEKKIEMTSKHKALVRALSDEIHRSMGVSLYAHKGG